jgi:hypothetical protein
MQPRGRAQLMRVRSLRLLIPAGLTVCLLVPAAPAAVAAHTPPALKTQRLTGILQTIIREEPPGEQSTATRDTVKPDTVKPGTIQPDAVQPRAVEPGTVEPGTVQPDAADDTTKILRMGSTIVPLSDGSLPTTKDGTTVSVTVVPGAEGTKRVVTAETISAPPDLTVPATHQVYVARVLPAGMAADASITDASVRAMVAQVSGYWSSQTGAKVSFNTAQVLPAYQSAYACSSSYTSTYNMWNEALAKMPAAVGPGRHLVLIAPRAASASTCPYGLGSVGGVEASNNEVFVSGLNQSLLAHELGHNLGLYHSNSLRCTGVQDMPVVNRAFPGCQANAYDDLLDVMGYSGTNYGEGNLNAVHLSGMNLLPAAVRTIAASSGVTSVRVAPLSTTTDGRALKITDPSGASYFVEYRTSSGRDTVAARNPWRPSLGVRVMRDDPAVPAAGGSYELDATPTSLSSSDYNRSIPVGATFRSASKGLSINVASQDATGASLTITNLAAPVLPVRVTLTVPTRVVVGASITATTTVTDQQGQPVPAWGVALQKQQKGTTPWVIVASLRTGSNGKATYRFINKASGSYRWVTSPSAGAPSKVSPLMAITSTARITSARPARTMARGTFLKVSGTVSSVSAPAVYIQYRYGGGAWRTGPRATVTGTKVSGRVKLSVRATASIRLAVRTSTSYLGSVSGYYVTTVR